MALGKNLKKQKLIPEDSGKPPKKKVSSSKRKPVSRTKAKPKIEKPKAAIQVKDEFTSPQIEKPKITQEVYDYRKKIRKKYNDEIDQLSGYSLQLIVFKLGSDFYALSIKQLNEVVLTPSVTRIPHAPEHIVGTANVRGKVMPLIDLEVKYKLKDKSLNDEYPMYIMVLSTDLGNVGILTNEVPTTLTVMGDDVEKISELVSSSILDESFIKGLIKSNNQLVSLIDLNEMIENEKIKVVPAT